MVLVVALFVGAAIPQVGNYHVMTVLSGSMEPTLRVGSMAVIVPKEDYQLEDIVTYTTGGEIPTTHRIVDKKVTGGELVFITRGDANPTEDVTNVKKEDIIGKVAFSIPLLGHVIEFVRTPVGFALLVGLPALLIIIGEVKNIYKEVKTTDEE